MNTAAITGASPLRNVSDLMLVLYASLLIRWVLLKLKGYRFLVPR